MCTLTRDATDARYELFFNRDERRTRPAAQKPTIQLRESVRFAAPIDTEGGGSWIAVNEFGLTACVLNGFEDGARLDPRICAITRGSLPLEMMPCRTPTEARGRLAGVELERFRPFVLVVVGFRVPGWSAHWTGREISVEESIASPLISSSFCTEEVRSSRLAVFQALRIEIPQDTIERHLSFHRSHRPQRSAHSPCMHREDAHTVSLTRVTVNADLCRLSYWGDSPCRARGDGDPVELARRPPFVLGDRHQ